MAKIGMDSKKQGDLNAITSKSIPEILKEITDSGGIAIGAHAYSDKGIISGMSGQQRTSLIQDPNLRGIEVANIENAKYFDGSDPTYKRLLACIKGSDAHSLEEIGKEFILLKMGEPNINGLKQALSDRESRIRYSPSELHNHPCIIGMYIEGGFLDGQIFRFNENLNSIIGGKGTGKTTAIELLRFVLSSQHKTQKMREEFKDMTNGILGRGMVSVLLRGKGGQFYIIQRKLGEDLKIFREDGQILEMSIESFSEFFSVESYSQGELFAIAKDGESQLKMLDQYINFGTLKDDEKNLIIKLNANATTLVNNNSSIIELKRKLERLPSIVEQIRVLEEKGLKDHNSDQKKWEYERSILEGLINNIRTKLVYLNSNLDKALLSEADINSANIINEEIIKKFVSEYSSLNVTLKVNQRMQIENLENTLNRLVKEQEEWNKKYLAQKIEFEKVVNELKSKGIDADGYLQLELERNNLERLKEELKKKESDSNIFIKERETMINELVILRQSITKKRKEMVSIINNYLKTLLYIELKEEDNWEDYSNWMISTLSGSYASKEETKILCQKIKPLVLVDTMNKYNSADCIDLIYSRTGVNKTYIQKVIEYPQFTSKLFDLQIIKVEDSLEIKLFDGEWKSINSLSAGGKCTAILLMAMLDRDMPLLIDQPEDSLDNSFIYTGIVQTIRKLKDKRQIIVVTHNANIPVLGDCELMFVLQSNGLRGNINSRGVIDNSVIKEKVQVILEGGQEAFKRRKEKYGI